MRQWAWVRNPSRVASLRPIIAEKEQRRIPMRATRRDVIAGIGAGTAVLALPHVACAQAWPSRPVTFVVPFPAGGPTDTIARLFGERLRQSLGQTVIIENVAGA